MRLRDATVIVTGGGSGIGAALVRRFAREGATGLVVVDRNATSAARVAAEVGGVAEPLDVTDEAALRALVARTEDRFGAVDMFCANAGTATGDGLDATAETWHAMFELHVIAHVYAARAVLPGMLARGRGYLLHTASAAGLLTAPGDAPYAVTKHATVALAEWIALKYGHLGVGVSVLCPLGVDTPLLRVPLDRADPAALAVAASGPVITADEVADAVVAGLDAQTFLILPHPQVGRMWQQKASDPDRWLAGVRRRTNR
jgi:NAD(P)-dependent dehydrogenase (short-subunit alcohol dehydrogenase family)